MLIFELSVGLVRIFDWINIAYFINTFGFLCDVFRKKCLNSIVKMYLTCIAGMAFIDVIQLSLISRCWQSI